MNYIMLHITSTNLLKKGAYNTNFRQIHKNDCALVYNFLNL